MEGLLTTAMKQSDRYRILKKEGMSDAAIEEFPGREGGNEGLLLGSKEVDTLMTPWDSIR